MRSDLSPTNHPPYLYCFKGPKPHQSMITSDPVTSWQKASWVKIIKNIDDTTFYLFYHIIGQLIKSIDCIYLCSIQTNTKNVEKKINIFFYLCFYITSLITEHFYIYHISIDYSKVLVLLIIHIYKHLGLLSFMENFETSCATKWNPSYVSFSFTNPR